MKNTSLLLIMALAFTTMFLSCEEDDSSTVGGDQSPMGEVGTTISSSSVEISGVSNFQATVTSLGDGVSTYKGSAIVHNTFLKNLVSNIPEITVKGDTVSTESMKFKNTTEGVELMTGPTSGIWVKYGSNVGDTYPIGSTGEVRTVKSKSTTDDYYYGFLLIKVVEVEENPTFLRGTGVDKITYWGNHRFGLVGIDFSFGDGTSASFPVYTSSENGK